MSVKFRPTPLSEKELKDQLLASQMALAELSIAQADAQLQNEIAIAELSILIAGKGETEDV
ncbi:MAG: hypothetical protein WHF31_16390 [Candidatus Dehalobacter alkaniphilus]